MQELIDRLVKETGVTPEQAVKTYVDGRITGFTSSVTTLQNTLAANVTTNNNALAGKEDQSNKSTTTTLGSVTNPSANLAVVT